MGVLGTGVTFIMYAILSNPKRQGRHERPGGFIRGFPPSAARNRSGKPRIDYARIVTSILCVCACLRVPER